MISAIRGVEDDIRGSSSTEYSTSLWLVRNMLLQPVLLPHEFLQKMFADRYSLSLFGSLPYFFDSNAHIQAASVNTPRINKLKVFTACCSVSQCAVVCHNGTLTWLHHIYATWLTRTLTQGVAYTSMCVDEPPSTWNKQTFVWMRAERADIAAQAHVRRSMLEHLRACFVLQTRVYAHMHTLTLACESETLSHSLVFPTPI